MAFGRCSFLLSIVGCCALAQGIQARKWEDCVEESIYAQSHVDLPRIQYAIEENHLSVAPSVVLLESQPPSDAPSSVPTYYEEEEEEKLECPEGEILYQINMTGVWGDGSGGTTLEIQKVGILEGPVPIRRSFNPRASFSRGNRKLGEYAFSEGVESEGVDSRNICLSSLECYQVVLDGGNLPQNAEWEISTIPRVDFGPIVVANGTSFTNCTFHVAIDPIIQPNCPFTCQPREEQSQAETQQEVIDVMAQESIAKNETTSAPTSVPTSTPSLVPTQGITSSETFLANPKEEETATGAPTSTSAPDTDSPSPAPSTDLSTLPPSDAPSLVPTI